MQRLLPARPARAPRRPLHPAQRSPALPPRRPVLQAPRRLLLPAIRLLHALLLILFLPLSRTTSVCLLPSVSGGSELRTNQPAPSLELPLPISPESVPVSRQLRPSWVEHRLRPWLRPQALARSHTWMPSESSLLSLFPSAASGPTREYMQSYY